MDEASPEFYRDPDPQLCQGDIVANLFHAQLKPPVRVLRARSTSHGQVFDPYGLDNPPEGGFRLTGGDADEVIASCQEARGILLTHDCEIDKKDNKHRMIALIRPIEPLRPESAQQIRDNVAMRYFYLPSWGDRLDESYVDFRRVSCVDARLVDIDKRLASLTERAREQLLAAFFIYITRADPVGLTELMRSR